jgi:hypothetical protein
VTRDGRLLLQDPVLATRIAEAEIDFIALEITNLRVIWKLESTHFSQPSSARGRCQSDLRARDDPQAAT